MGEVREEEEEDEEEERGTIMKTLVPLPWMNGKHNECDQIR